ncbi:MAG: twin-arginine translocase TatA/TatE family subunit [Pyrinomonadaceae bacterium]
MFALILDSLGSTELLFILVIALIFFGPRKLPQLARQMGKSLAEFRKASEDFKRTWEREVALESTRIEPGENTMLTDTTNAGVPSSSEAGWVEPTNAEHSIARAPQFNTEPTSDGADRKTAPAEAPPKHDWL